MRLRFNKFEPTTQLNCEKVRNIGNSKDGDVGGLIGIHRREETRLSNPIVSIDGIVLKEFDFIDIGALLEISGVVPVVIKSLVFPANAAVGRKTAGS